MRVVDDAGLDARPGGEPGPELVALGRAEVAEVGSGGTLAAQEVSIGAELRTPASGPGHPGSPRPGHPGSRDRTPADLGIAAGTVTGSNDGGFTLVTASGLDIQVTTSASTTVYTMEDTSLSGLRTGAFTAAAGQAGPDGTLAATAVHQGAHLPVGGPGRPGTSLPRLPAGVGCSSAAVTTALLTAG